jgi:HD-GYP domain-containing protein (c-di-GMP phosphodiesterase class II)
VALSGSGATAGFRLAELLATVSLASDLAHDVPAESALRDALLAIRLGRLAGWPAQDLADVYYLALLYHIGCTAAVDAQSRLGAGDDVAVRRWLSEADFSDRPELLRIAIGRLGRQWGPVEWARGLAALATAGPGIPVAFAGMAEVAARLSSRLGATPPVSAALGHAYARWDGKVFPDVASGQGQSVIARLVHLVHVAQTYDRAGGVESADTVVRERTGGEFDPELARLWLGHSREVLGSLTSESVWDEVLAAEPEPHRLVPASHLDTVFAAFADFVDLKSPYTHGHSTRLARLVEDAAGELGMARADVVTLRRAAQAHDLGNLSVPNVVWSKRGSLNPAQWARVRLHAYHTERILGVSDALRGAGQVAGLHHERLDGTGYHRELPAVAIPLAARVLMVAEAYQSMTEERSWRPAMTPRDAAAEVRREVSARRLDRRAADAVLLADGHPSPRGRAARAWPAGLTDREVDVLRLLAVGRSNKEMARRLFVSEATVHTHVINAYGKIGVNTRAGATLFALEHDLVQVPGSEKID